MTSSSASDHVNPAGIAALMQKGTTSKGMEANKNCAKWLSCGIQISGTFGLHHVKRPKRDVYHLPRLRMSGVVRLLSLHAFMA
jgi:hypothetical protein